MVRLRAPDYLNGKGTKYETKEWTYYKEEWEGKNMFDVPLFMRNEHYEGVCTKRFFKPEMNSLTGEMVNAQDVNKRQLVLLHSLEQKECRRYYCQVSKHIQEQYKIHNKVLT